jgi:hypothetical protein
MYARLMEVILYAVQPLVSLRVKYVMEGTMIVMESLTTPGFRKKARNAIQTPILRKVFLRAP